MPTRLGWSPPKRIQPGLRSDRQSPLSAVGTFSIGVVLLCLVSCSGQPGTPVSPSSTAAVLADDPPGGPARGPATPLPGAEGVSPEPAPVHFPFPGPPTCFGNHSTTVGPCATALRPTLLAPMARATLDNGCTDHSNEQRWVFMWATYPNASHYELFVKHPPARFPAIDARGLTSPRYVDASDSWVANQNRRGWRWRVRAFVNGEWSPWSPERVFDVEPVNSDCR